MSMLWDAVNAWLVGLQYHAFTLGYIALYVKLKERIISMSDSGLDKGLTVNISECNNQLELSVM